MKFGTKTVHAGARPDPSTGAIMTPVFLSSTYVQSSPGEHKGYDYSRAGNPTRSALEETLAILENGKHALAFASGMAAEDAIIKLLKPGDHVICSHDLYGGSYRMFTQVYTHFGIKFSFVDMTEKEEVREAINENTRMIWAESPTNPLMSIVDIEAMASLSREKDILLVVDNTFASPALQNPLDLGADIVMHSITKYLSGHSDVVMGCTVVNDPALQERLYFIQKSCGAIPGPMDCFLVLRGIKTLAVRIRQHCANGRMLATFLNEHPLVERVYYPGLPFHPGHSVAERQMSDFGGMLSFTLKGDNIEDAMKLMRATKLFSLAESLGGVESLIGHPATMTHASIPREERLKAGLKDTLIRLSCGIEDGEDLVEDLRQAIEGA